MMTSTIYDVFGTSAIKERDGIEADFGPAGKFFLARAGGNHSKFNKIVEAKTRPYRRQIKDETLDKDLADTLSAEAFSEGCMLGWEGVCTKDGKPIKFNTKNATKLLLDLPELFADLRERAINAANFRDVEVEEAGEN
jgi:hypothetical protein